MPQSSDSLDGVITGHEERLQRVETTVQETAVSVAEIGVKQDFMAAALGKHQEDTTKRLETGFSRIEAAVGKIVDKIHEHGERLEPLEASVAASDRRRHERMGFMKKSAVGALLAAGGVFATKAGELLWTWMGSR